jgi:Zn-finger nucleic acid-binding protein
MVAEDLERLSESSRRCPLCAVPLLNSRLHGHPLLSCPQCEGLLIEMNRFTTVIDAVREYEVGLTRSTSPRRQNPGERRITCPLCLQPMLAHHYGGPGNIVLDTCERCLVNWLDRGELRRIAMARDNEIDD